MNHFKGGNLANLAAKFAVFQQRFAYLSTRQDEALHVVGRESNIYTSFLAQLKKGVADFRASGISDGARRLSEIHKHVDRPSGNAAALNVEARNAREIIVDELRKRKFLRVAADRRDFLDSDFLFGRRVSENFKSARDDVREAGNCLAAECSTAAVFHLMCVAEIGLRALAYDRRVRVFKNKSTLFELPLDLASWDQILKELEGAELAIQNYPQTPEREAQFDFYHGAGVEVKRFKNIFRNRIMHKRRSYDRDEALSVFNHTKAFMQILAARITEGQRTPEIWRGAKFKSA